MLVKDGFAGMSVSGRRFSASRSRRVRITSTRSFGRMKPPAPVLRRNFGRDRAHAGRQHGGHEARAVALDQLGFAHRLADDERRARDRTGELLDRVGLVVALMKFGLAAAAARSAIACRARRRSGPSRCRPWRPGRRLYRSSGPAPELTTFSGERPASRAAMPPAATATTRTTIRAGFIRFTFQVTARLNGAHG